MITGINNQLMKQFLILLLFVSISIPISAQSTVAKIKYEQAEEAFNKGNFRITLNRLEEVQQLLHEVNPKIMYLRIMAQHSLVEKGGYSFGLLDSLRKNIDFYVKSYETNTAVEDKFREVYLLGEKLIQFPSTKEEYDKLTAVWKMAEEKKMAEEQANLTLKKRSKQFVDSLVNEYKFLPCASIEEFKKFNTTAGSTITKAYPSNYFGRPYVPFSNMLKEGPWSFHVSQYPAGLLIDSFSVICMELNKKSEKKEALQKWKDLIFANFSANSIGYDAKIGNTITVKESADIPVGISISLLELNRDVLILTFSHSCENEPKNKKSP